MHRQRPRAQQFPNIKVVHTPRNDDEIAAVRLPNGFDFILFVSQFNAQMTIVYENKNVFFSLFSLTAH